MEKKTEISRKKEMRTSSSRQRHGINNNGFVNEWTNEREGRIVEGVLPLWEFHGKKSTSRSLKLTWD